MPEVIMPRLSDTMEDGVIASWLKKVGDPVARGEVIAEIETDKALMELEAYDDGVLEQILVDAGARVPIGETIGIVGDGSGASSSTAAPRPARCGREFGPRRGALRPGRNGGGRRGHLRIHRDSGRGHRRAPQVLAAGAQGRPRTGGGHRGRHRNRPGRTDHPPGCRKHLSHRGIRDPGSGTDDVIRDRDRHPRALVRRVRRAAVDPHSAGLGRPPHREQAAGAAHLPDQRDRRHRAAGLPGADQRHPRPGKGKVSVNDLLVKAVASTLRTDPAVNVSFAGESCCGTRGFTSASRWRPRPGCWYR